MRFKLYLSKPMSYVKICKCVGVMLCIGAPLLVPPTMFPTRPPVPPLHRDLHAFYVVIGLVELKTPVCLGV